MCLFTGKLPLRIDRRQHHKRLHPELPRSRNDFAVILSKQGAAWLEAVGKHGQVGQIGQRFAQHLTVDIRVGITVDGKFADFILHIGNNQPLPGINAVVAVQLRVVLPERIHSSAEFHGNIPQRIAPLDGI